MICNLFSVPTFSKIACFNTGSSFLPDILGDFKSQVENNKQQEVISACAELAFDKGYRFFALGYNSLCRSGPNVRDEYHKEGATSDNNCPNGIGVNKRIAVYTFGKSLAEDRKKTVLSIWTSTDIAAWIQNAPKKSRQKFLEIL